MRTPRPSRPNVSALDKPLAASSLAASKPDPLNNQLWFCTATEFDMYWNMVPIASSVALSIFQLARLADGATPLMPTPLFPCATA